MAPELLKAAYELGSEAYWAKRAQGEQLSQNLMDALMAITDAMIRMMEEEHE